MKKTEAILWHVKNSKKEYPIKIRTFDGKYKYFNVNLTLPFKKYFDFDNGLVKETFPDHKRYNTVIKEKLAQFKVEHSSSDSFKDYLKRHYEALFAAGRNGNAKKFQVMYNKLNKWHPSDIKFIDLNPVFLKEFHLWLQSTGINPNTIQINLNKLKRICNIAMAEKLLVGESMFKHFRYNGVTVESKAMTADEFEYFKAYDLADELLDKYRDESLMLFFSNGTRVGDAILWKYSNIKNGHIEYSMRKTKKLMKIKISKPLAKIMVKRLPDEFEVVVKRRDYLKMVVKKSSTDDLRFIKLYAMEHPDQHIFRYLDGFKGNEKEMYNKIQSVTSLWNKQLTKVCDRIPIDPISSHVMRHTFATRFLAVKKDINTLSSLLGHSSLLMTIKYIKTLGVDVVNKKSDEFYNAIW